MNGKSGALHSGFIFIQLNMSGFNYEEPEWLHAEQADRDLMRAYAETEERIDLNGPCTEEELKWLHHRSRYRPETQEDLREREDTKREIRELNIQIRAAPSEQQADQLRYKLHHLCCYERVLLKRIAKMHQKVAWVLRHAK